MPFDAETVERPEVALSPRYNALWGKVLAWLDRGGDEQRRFDMGHWQTGCPAVEGSAHDRQGQLRWPYAGPLGL